MCIPIDLYLLSITLKEASSSNRYQSVDDTELLNSLEKETDWSVLNITFYIFISLLIPPAPKTQGKFYILNIS